MTANSTVDSTQYHLVPCLTSIEGQVCQLVLQLVTGQHHVWLLRPHGVLLGRVIQKHVHVIRHGQVTLCEVSRTAHSTQYPSAQRSGVGVQPCHMATVA